MKTVAVLDRTLSIRKGGPRYILVDEETGAVVDDAQGHGYKNAESAFHSHHYKQTRAYHREMDEKDLKRREARIWALSHPVFYQVLDEQVAWLEEGGDEARRPDIDLVCWLLSVMWPDEEVDATALFYNWEHGVGRTAQPAPVV